MPKEKQIVNNIKNITRRTTFLFLALLFLSISLSALYVPGSASAAAAGATTIPNDSTTICSATVQGPVDAAPNFSGTPYGPDMTPLTSGFDVGAVLKSMNGATVPQAALDVITAIATRKSNVIVVSFGSDGGNNNAACKSSLAFFRLPDATNKTTFYGLWGPKLNVVTGTVSVPNKSITFGLPNGVNAAVALADPSNLLAGSYFNGGTSTGGGSTSTTSFAICLNNFKDQLKQIQANCLDKFGTAGFIDVAHINYQGETYTAQQWGGAPSLSYALDPTDKTDPALVSLSPSFSLDLAEDGPTAIGISGDLTSTQNIQDNLKRVLALKGSVNIPFFLNNSQQGAVSTSYGGISQVAHYFPNSKDPTQDVVILNFTNGAGSNEQHFYGSYTKVDATTFTLNGGGFAGCGTNNQPRFKLNSAPTKAQMDGSTVIRADWFMQANSTPCSEIAVPVLILIEKADTVPPVDTSLTQTTGASSPEARCNATILNPLTWIACPLISAASDAINVIDGQINCLLQIDLTDVFGPGTNKTNPGAAQCGTSSNGETSTAYYAAWNSFRIISIALIVIAGLIMIISEAAGMQFLDAYTIRKTLPRLLIAIIAITLSWQILEFLIILTNAVGFGVREIIYYPFRQFGSLDVSGLGTTFAADLLVGGAFLALGLAGVASFALTALLAVLIAFITLIVRKLVIIFLILFAPVAIACYILPNTQKFWKLWWETLTKSLIMFPLIAAFIAIGRVFSVTIYNNGNTSTVNEIIAFIAYFAPYFMIPFAVRLAGGAVATIGGLANDRGRGAFDRLKNFRRGEYQKHGAHRVEDVNRRTMSKRADFNQYLQDKSSAMSGDGITSRIGRRALAGAGRATSGYNLEAGMSQKRAAVAKEINEQIATGRDEEIRGLLVDKRHAEELAARGDNSLMRVQNGKRQFKSLAGKWVDEAAVDAGQKRWGNDDFAKQAALSYEMRKADKVEDVQSIKDNYLRTALATGQSRQQAEGNWVGAAYENAGQHLELKYTSADGSMSAEQAAGFASEAYEKKGSYQLSQMHASTIQALGKAYDVGDADTKNKIAGVSEVFMSRMGAGGVAGMEGDVPIQRQGAPGAQAEQFQTMAPGAAHVAESVRALAVKTGVYQVAPPGPPAAGPYPPIDRQN